MQNTLRGGAPPHTQAGQQLRDQHRAVEAARLALARCHRAEATAQPAITLAA